MRGWQFPPLIAGGTVAAAALLAVGMTAAAATPIPATVAQRQTLFATSTETPEQAVAFWTPERLASARSMDLLPAPKQPSLSHVREPRGQTRSVPPVAPSGSATRSAVGKIFFEEYQADTHKWELASCSGVAVSSPHGNLVATAGHCVMGRRTHRLHRNWIFVPGYRNGNNEPVGPFGAFPSYGGEKFHLFTSWGQNGDFGHDVAFVEVAPDKAGHRLQSVVGAQGIRVNQGTNQDVLFIGYAVNHKQGFDGEQQQSCRGTTYPDPDDPQNQLELVCNLGYGASGGPWLVGYDQLGRGFVNGLDSNGDDVKVEDSAYFGNDVWTLYTQAAR